MFAVFGGAGKLRPSTADPLPRHPSTALGRDTAHRARTAEMIRALLFLSLTLASATPCFEVRGAASP